jgi:hypothetical protein
MNALETAVANVNLLIPSIVQDMQLVEHGWQCWRLVTHTKPAVSPAYQLETLVTIRQIDPVSISVIERDAVEARTLCLADREDYWQFLCLAVDALLLANPGPDSQARWDQTRAWLEACDDDLRNRLLTGLRSIVRYMPPPNWSIRLGCFDDQVLRLALATVSTAAPQQLEIATTPLIEFRHDHDHLELRLTGEEDWVALPPDGLSRILVSADVTRAALAQGGVFQTLSVHATEQAADWANFLGHVRTGLQAAPLPDDCRFVLFGEGPHLTVFIQRYEQQELLLRLKTLQQKSGGQLVEVTVGAMTVQLPFVLGVDLGFLGVLLLALFERQTDEMWDRLGVQCELADILAGINDVLRLDELLDFHEPMFYVQWCHMLFVHWTAVRQLKDELVTIVGLSPTYQKNGMASLAFGKSGRDLGAGTLEQLSDLTCVMATLVFMESLRPDAKNRVQLCVSGERPRWLPDEIFAKLQTIRDTALGLYDELYLQYQSDLQADAQESQQQQAQEAPRLLGRPTPATDSEDCQGRAPRNRYDDRPPQFK